MARRSPTIVQPYNIILCKAFVEDVSGKLMQAAEIDGAGTMRGFYGYDKNVRFFSIIYLHNRCSTPKGG